MLLAEKEAALEKDQRLIELKEWVQQLKSEGASDKDINRAKNKVRSYYDSLWRMARQNYQTWWVQNQRDWKIRTQGKEKAEDFTPTQLVQTLSMIIPERGHLTEIMISDKIISELERKQAVTDLYSFITRDYTVLYRPGEELIGGACPVNDCRKKMEG
jgi:hypothetical protein